MPELWCEFRRKRGNNVAAGVVNHRLLNSRLIGECSKQFSSGVCAVEFDGSREMLPSNLAQGRNLLLFPMVQPLNVAVDQITTGGFELTSTMQITECWSLRGGYSFLRINDSRPRLHQLTQC